MGDRPAEDRAIRVSETSMPSTVEARLREGDRERQPDVAEADHGHPAILGHPARLALLAGSGMAMSGPPGAASLVGDPTRS